MEFERMNDNTIRVIVDHDDLEERGISLSDLLENRDNIERFFYSILDDIELDDDFVDTRHMSFQVLPSKRGLELFISRLKDDMDAEEMLEMLASSSKIIKKQVSEDIPETTKQALSKSDTKVSKKETRITSDIMVRFNSLYSLLDIRKFIQLNLVVGLYVYHESYYAHVVFPKSYNNDVCRDIIATLLEFGNLSALASATIQEHGQLLTQNYSLQK